MTWAWAAHLMGLFRPGRSDILMSASWEGIDGPAEGI